MQRLNDKHVTRNLKRITWTALTGLLLWLAVIAGQATRQVALPEAGDPPRFYSTQTRNDLRQTFLGAFQRAEQEILVVIYALSDEQLISSLRQKSEQGCKVTVLCDRSASKGVAKKLGPATRVIYSKGKGLMHQKIVVIDDTLTLIGSANMTTESLRHHGNMLTALHDPALATFVKRHTEFLTTREPSSALTGTQTVVASQPVTLRILPNDSAALKELVSLLDSAKKTLRIAMYTWTHPQLTQAVIDAHQRGVEVRIAIDRSTARNASREAVSTLASGGVPVALSDTAPLLHYKMAIIDDATLVTGSTNWTRSAFTKNDDCLLVIEQLDRNQQKSLHNMWRALWAESRDVQR